MGSQKYRTNCRRGSQQHQILEPVRVLATQSLCIPQTGEDTFARNPEIVKQKFEICAGRRGAC